VVLRFDAEVVGGTWGDFLERLRRVEGGWVVEG